MFTAARNKHRASYRTLDGRADYNFSFERQSDGNWRVYIEAQPSYGNRPDGAHATHRYNDGSRRYVCWTSPIKSLGDAKTVAATWANATQEYIRSGNQF